MRKTLTLILVLVLATIDIATFIPAHADSSTDSWPMFQHDPAHTGYSSSHVPETSTLAWCFPNPNITSVPIDNNHVISAPAIANGRLYVGGANGGGFYCLNASTGREIWSNPNNFVAASTSTPAFSDGFLFVSVSGLITALDASTGVPVWKTNFTNVLGNPEDGGSPTVADGVVYVGGYSALYALNAKTGVLLWKYPTDRSFASVLTSPAFSNGFVYTVGNYHDLESGYGYEGYVCAVDASNGNEVWSKKIGEVPQSSPTVYDGRVYAGSDDGNVYAFDALTGSLAWNYTTGSLVVGSPAAAKGLIYVGSWDEHFYAFNASTGEVEWSTFLPSGVSSSPAIAGDVVYFSSNDCYLYAFNASTGTQLWKTLTVTASDYFATSIAMFASPAVAYGSIYVGTNEGNVLAFGTPYVGPPEPEPEPFPIVPVAVAVFAVAAVGTAVFVFFRKHKPPATRPLATQTCPL